MKKSSMQTSGGAGFVSLLQVGVVWPPRSHRSALFFVTTIAAGPARSDRPMGEVILGMSNQSSRSSP
jgi:hypothetical protein